MITLEMRRFVDGLLAKAERTVEPCLDAGAPRESVVFGLDVSGSMASRDILPCRLTAAKAATERYVGTRLRAGSDDLLSAVVFNHEATDICRNISIRDAKIGLFRPLRWIAPTGSTNISAGLMAAEEILADSPTRFQRRVVLLSDGEDGGSPYRVADGMKARGIVIDTIGVGRSPSDIDEPCLMRVASTVDGVLHYRFIRNADELNAHFESIAVGLTRVRS